MNRAEALRLYLVDDEPEPPGHTLRDALEEILNTLPPSHRDVLMLRYSFDGTDRTYREIAAMFGLSIERIRQIEHKSIRKLRKLLRIHNDVSSFTQSSFSRSC